MKRYESLSKKEIITAYDSTSFCSTCILNDKCDKEKSSCNERIRKYLYQDILYKPRWEIIKCNDDLVTLYNDYVNKEQDKQISAYGFVRFLLQGIPYFD